MTKTMSFAAVHFSVAFTVGYVMTGSVLVGGAIALVEPAGFLARPAWSRIVMTGSVLVGGAIALVEPAINTVAYYLHERVWHRIQKARRPASKQFVAEM